MRKKLHFLLSLVALMCVAVTANAQLTDGKYYLQNVESGKYWGAGNDWGTRASLVKNPEYVTLIGNEKGTYVLESQVSNGGTNYYFTGDYMDGAPDTLTITPSGDYYTISGVNGYYGNGGTTILGKNLEEGSASALWNIISEEEMIASLASATAEKPVDATFLILDPNFGRNNRNVGAWTMEAGNKNLSGGNNINNCAESYHSTFTLSQAIANAPKGVYKLTAQGFYRQDGSDNENLPYIYLNDVKGGTFPLKTGSENNMSDASVSFTNGQYAIDPAFIELSEDGELTVGAKLEVNTALWCIWDNFELTYYGADADLTSLVFGELIETVEALRKKATELKNGGKVTETTLSLLESAIEASEDIEQTKEAYNEAIATLNAAISQAEKEVAQKTAIDAMYDILNNNVATAEAYDTYKALADDYLAKFEEGSLTETVVNPTAVTGWRANPLAVSDFLISAWDEATAYNWDSYHVNTWSVEGDTDGSNFRVPFIEYWTGDGEALATKTITATVEGVEPGLYEVSAWVRVRAKNGTAAADATGITLSANGGEAVDVTEGEVVGNSQFNLAEYKVIGEVGEDGILTITFDVATENISWLSFKNVKYVSTTAEEVAYKKALETIKDGNHYQISTTVEGADYYLKADGKLTADKEEAYNFEFKAVPNSSAEYGVGWNLGCRFTNPDTGTATGDVKQVGGIRVDSKNDRNDFERQVFFLNNNGQYAVRSTNGKGENWGANTYWTVFTTDTELPTAGHGENGVQHYIWQLTEVSEGEVLLAAAKAVVKAKEGIGDGLFEIPEEAYNTYAEAVAAAEAVITNENATDEEIAEAIESLKAANAVYANAVRKPVEGKPYVVENVTATGNLSVGDAKVTIEEDAKVYFTAVEGGYAISNAEGEYIFKTSNDNWTLSTTSDLASAYVLTVNIVEGGYTLQGSKGLLGTDNATAGSSVYADKNISKNGLWVISEYVPELVYVDLTAEMFHVWDGFGAEAQITEEKPNCEYNIGVSAGNIYGNSLVEQYQYADLTAYETLVLTVEEGTPRLLMNSVGATDPKTYLEIKEVGKYASLEGNVWTIDLAKITKEYGYAHLNAIKGANWVNATITSATLGKIKGDEEPEPQGSVYEGFLAENGVQQASGMDMGDNTEAQTVTIADPADGVTSITFSGINYVGSVVPMPITIPEFTIENVTVTENADGSVSYSCDEVVVAVPTGNMTTNYVGTLKGTKASADATPVITLVIANAVKLTNVFAATAEEAEAALKEELIAVGIDNVQSDAVKANGKVLENNKVVIYRNGVKYGVNGAVIK